MASFDYHAELNVETTATKAEIRQAYFQLALIHHPDKNPDNVAEATAKFQRLQTAYEALTKPSIRRQTGAAPSSHAHAPRYNPDQQDDSDGDYYGDYADYEDYYGFWSDDDDEPYFDIPRYHSYGSGGSSYHSFAFYEQLFEKYTQERSARAEAATRETQVRHRYEEQQRQARKAAKRAAEEAERNAEEALRAAGIAEERAMQNDIWTKAGAVTKDEKLRACLHSNFCRTGRQEKKTRCSSCNKVAGLRPFECPHCASFLCHQCQIRFARRREKAAVSQPESVVTSEPDTAEDVEEVENDLDTDLNENGCAGEEPEEADECLGDRDIPSSLHRVAEPERRPEHKARSSNGHIDRLEPLETKANPKPAAPRAQTIDDICLSAGIRVTSKSEAQVESDEELARRLQEEWNEQERRQTQARWYEEAQKENDNQPSKMPKQPPKQKTSKLQKAASDDATQPMKRSSRQTYQLYETSSPAEASEKIMKDTIGIKEVSGAAARSKASLKQAGDSKETRAASWTLNGSGQTSSQAKDAAAFGLSTTKPWTHKNPLKDVNTTTQSQPNGNTADRNSAETIESLLGDNDVHVSECTDKEKKRRPKKSRCTRCKRFGHLEDNCWFAHPELRKAAEENASEVIDSQMAEPDAVIQPSLSADLHQAAQSSQETDFCLSLNSEVAIEASGSGTVNHHAATKPRCSHCKRFGHVMSECWAIHSELKEITRAPLKHIEVKSRGPSVAGATSTDAVNTKKTKVKKERCADCKRQGHLESHCWVTHPELKQAAKSKRGSNLVPESPAPVNAGGSPGSSIDQAREHQAISSTLFTPGGSPSQTASQPQQVSAKSENFARGHRIHEAPLASKSVSGDPSSTRILPSKKTMNSNKFGQQPLPQTNSDSPKTAGRHQLPKQNQSPSSNMLEASEPGGYPVCLKLDTDSRSTSLLAVKNALIMSFGSLSFIRIFRPKAGIWHAEFAERDPQVKALKAGMVFVAGVKVRIER